MYTVGIWYTDGGEWHTIDTVATLEEARAIKTERDTLVREEAAQFVDFGEARIYDTVKRDWIRI